MNYPVEQQGFFVKVKQDVFKGPFISLNEARLESIIDSKNLEIYHGILILIDKNTVDSSKLFFIEIKKENLCRH